MPAGCNWSRKHYHYQDTDGTPRHMDGDDSLMAQWTNRRDAHSLLWLGSSNVLHTLEKAVITMALTTLEFRLLREMHFHLKSFILLRWVLLSAFPSFKSSVYYFHSTAGLIKLKCHSQQPANSTQGSNRQEHLVCWRQRFLSSLVSKLDLNWQDHSSTKIRSINCPVEGKGHWANVILYLISQLKPGLWHQIISL